MTNHGAVGGRTGAPSTPALALLASASSSSPRLLRLYERKGGKAIKGRVGPVNHTRVWGEERKRETANQSCCLYHQWVAMLVQVCSEIHAQIHNICKQPTHLPTHTHTKSTVPPIHPTILKVATITNTY
jgi:hypothetical protein